MLFFLISSALGSSFVLVPAEVWVRSQPAEDAPGVRRSTEAAPHAVSVAEEVERVEGWVHVRTLAETPEGAHCHPLMSTPGVALDGWVAEESLAPVLTTTQTVETDGASLTLKPGQRVVPGDPHTLPAFGWAVALALPEAAIGDHYEPAAPFEGLPPEGEPRRIEAGTVLRASGDAFVFSPTEGLPLRLQGDITHFRSPCVSVAAPADGPLVVGAGGLAGVARPMAPTAGGETHVPAGTPLVRPDGSAAGITVTDWITDATDEGELRCAEVRLSPAGEGSLTACFATSSPAEHAAAAPLPFHPKQLKLKRRVAPRFPLGVTETTATCAIRVVLSDAGRPLEVEASRCSPPFAEAAEAAVLRWRWQPPPIEPGQRAETVVGVKFQRQ